MPKQTFFNLPEEKQEVLIAAAKKEFSRVPLNEASIANIVKSAKIPRGSFYQYFEDKEDAFFYLLEKQTKVHSGEFVQILKTSEGDIFAAFLGVFQNMLESFQDQEHREFYRNTFLNMNYKMENKLSKGFRLNHEKIDLQIQDLIENIDFESLNIASKGDLKHILHIIQAVTLQNLMLNFAKRYTVEEAVAVYAAEMNLLKEGLVR